MRFLTVFIFFSFFLVQCSSPATLNTTAPHDTSVNNDTNSNDSPFPTDSTFILPVQGHFSDLTISDNFGPRQLNGSYDFHRGLDIQLDLNDPIYAAKAGTIIFAGIDTQKYPRSGKFIVIEHANLEFTSYLHLNEINSQIVKDYQVEQGEEIGTAGNSGENINSIHLHFNYHQSDISGEIPSFSTTTLPPLMVLPFTDYSNHKINSITLDSSQISKSFIQVQTSVPSSELDLNRISVSISENNTVIYSRTVEYSSRTNCGTDDDLFNNIQIIPEDFKSKESSYETDFIFNDINLSNYAGQTVIVSVTIEDVGKNQIIKTQSFTL